MPDAYAIILNYMSYVCFNCQKGTIKGTQHRHKPGVAGRQHLRRAPKTPKNFLPNLHMAYLLENGSRNKVLLCTKCRRMLKKQGKIRVWKKPEEKKVIKQAPVAAKKPTKKVKEVKKEEEPKPKVSVEDLVGKKK